MDLIWGLRGVPVVVVVVVVVVAVVVAAAGGGGGGGGGGIWLLIGMPLQHIGSYSLLALLA